MSDTCGLLYLDVGPACALRRDHPPDLSEGLGPVHRAADGTRWTHHEEHVGFLIDDNDLDDRYPDVKGY